MTIITVNAGTITQFDNAFAAVIGFCAEFCGSARQGREIETGYAQPGRHSSPDRHEPTPSDGGLRH